MGNKTSDHVDTTANCGSYTYADQVKQCEVTMEFVVGMGNFVYMYEIVKIILRVGSVERC
jgi:hypothetical protein